MKFTIFTPTYNRAHLLPRLFESLQDLDFKDFEWIIVDDGSTDMTNKVVRQFSDTATFKIRYFRQVNKGKHAAINVGVKEARSEFIYIVDSDDWLPANALRIALKYCDRLNLIPITAGVIGKRSFANTENDLPFEERVSTPLEMRYRFNLNFDLADIYRTDILKKYPFPVFPGEKFVTESLVWFRIAQSYKMLYFNEVIYHCEYQQGGLSENYRKLVENNPKGSLLYFRELLSYNIPDDAKKTAARNFNSIAHQNGYNRFWVLRKLRLRNYLRLFF